MDENRRQTGDLQLKIQIFDAQSYQASHLEEENKITSTSKLTLEITRRIV
jgi:hypothetical protein